MQLGYAILTFQSRILLAFGHWFFIESIDRQHVRHTRLEVLDKREKKWCFKSQLQLYQSKAPKHQELQRITCWCLTKVDNTWKKRHNKKETQLPVDARKLWQ